MEVECNKNKNIKQIFYRFCRDVEKIKMPDNMEKAAVVDGESNGGEWAEIAAMPSYEDKMKAAEGAVEPAAENKEAEPAHEHVDLNAEAYSQLFAEAPIYKKKAKIEAVQITAEGLESGEYADKDIRFDGEKYVIDTYVMREKDGQRVAELEDTRPVAVGEWIATNPSQQEGDRTNNYAIPDETFRKRYQETDEPGVYRAAGMARIIKNATGKAVEIEAPWGGEQYGDEECYFCAPYDPNNPEDLAEGGRYILSENDFATYELDEQPEDDEEDGTVKKRPLMESHPGLESDLNSYPDPNMYPLEDPETLTTPPDEGPQFSPMTPPMEEPKVGMTELPVVDEDGNPNTVNLENEPAPERHEMTSEELDEYMQQLMGRGAKVMAAAETPVAAETVEETVVAEAPAETGAAATEAPEAVAPTTETPAETPAGENQ